VGVWQPNGGRLATQRWASGNPKRWVSGNPGCLASLYDGSDPVMDFNSSGSLEMRYLNGPTGDLVDTVIARESAGGTIAWYLPDRLGTIRDLINNSGGIIDHVDYSAFGTVLDESSPSNGDRMMGFAGMERDTVTGLNLAVYRVENPGTGRWDSEDPLSFLAGDTDLYRYASNEPTIHADQSGEFVPIVIGVIAVVGGAVLFNPSPVYAPTIYDPPHPPGGNNGATTGMLLACAGGTILGKLGRIGSLFGGSSSPSCFVAGTPVATEAGLRLIEVVREGENVWSYDFKKGEWFLKPVLSTMRRDFEGTIVSLGVGSETIRSTHDHPFWVLEGTGLAERESPRHVAAGEAGSIKQGRWVDAGDLKVGDVLMLRGGSLETIGHVSSQVESVEVFNLGVAELSNYCVGENELLVHNRPGPGGGSSPKKGAAGGPNPGHKPGRGHRDKTDIQATKKFAREATKERMTEEEAFADAVQRWNALGPARQKFLPELNPQRLFPVLWRRLHG
jgi:RHS repeat-associated protein